ncbi:MAG: ribbon-helix-helix protein, CopG family [Betaproteobacteria bacterium]|nr:ribbon-helix-helix protein, CopG family [Betaproteobacteria bacterium]
MSTVATSLKLPPDLKKRIDELARVSGQSTHAFMLQALQLHVEEAEKHRRFVADALAADEEMERTGQGYPFDKARAYLEARIIGKPAARPRKVSWRK